MLTYRDVQRRLGEELRKARAGKHWSYRQTAAEITRIGGKVSAKTIEHMEKAATDTQLSNLYWASRAVGMALGELLAFTVLDEDRRAHALLAQVIRGKPDKRTSLMNIMELLK